MPMMNQEYSKFNKDGKYRSDNGTEDANPVEGASVCLPPDTENLADFEEGDELDIQIKGRKSGTDEEGNVTIDPISITVNPMTASGKMFRRDQKSSMPPKETMSGGMGEEM